jgi:hypothetical protein
MAHASFGAKTIAADPDPQRDEICSAPEIDDQKVSYAQVDSKRFVRLTG